MDYDAQKAVNHHYQGC